jgi:hypothetical protein
MPRVKDFIAPTSVWSAHGHRFMSDGNGADEFGYWRESCLTCGAMFELRHARAGITPNSGEYVGYMGAEPMACTGDTSMVHGDPSEQEHGLDCETGCDHCRHDCNCVICTA